MTERSPRWTKIRMILEQEVRGDKLIAFNNALLSFIHIPIITNPNPTTPYCGSPLCVSGLRCSCYEPSEGRPILLNINKITGMRKIKTTHSHG